MPDATSEDLGFKEIEHKFIVDAGFDLDRFGRSLAALNPVRTTSLRVRDRYYLIRGSRAGQFVIRHRFDDELHHLTVKTFEADAEVRQEVNIDLGHHAGDQRAQVDAFLAQLGIDWSGALQKELRVWYFPDAEVVHYQAMTDTRSVCCVEFEATRKASVPAALEIVRRYEEATGFHATTRSQESLLQILFPEVADRLSRP